MREWARVLGITPTVPGGQEVHREAAPGDAHARHAGHQPLVGTAGPSVPGDPAGRHRRAGRQVRDAGRALLLRQPARARRCSRRTAKCNGCPPNYKPPRQCKYGRDGRLRRDLLPARLLQQRRLRRGLHPAQPHEPLQRLLRGLSGATDGDDRRRLPRAAAEPEPEPRRRRPGATAEPQTGLQCDPPRSQLEAEQCAAQRGEAPQNTPVPEPTPHPEPEPTPGICNDGQDNEGVPGLIDGDDPNCQ